MGLLDDTIDWMTSPKRAQQMQGVGNAIRSGLLGIQNAANTTYQAAADTRRTGQLRPDTPAQQALDNQMINAGFSMFPQAIIPGGMNAAFRNLSNIASGNRVQPVKIAELTDSQFNELNALRQSNGFEPLPSKDVHYIGSHHLSSRSADGYEISDMLKQLMSGLDDTSKPVIDNFGRANLTSSNPRYDGYASDVTDVVPLIASKGKTISEAYSAIPKGDRATLKVLEKKMAGVPPGVNYGVSQNQRMELNQPSPSVITEDDVRNWISQDQLNRSR